MTKSAFHYEEYLVIYDFNVSDVGYDRWVRLRDNLQWGKILCQREDGPTATLTVAVSAIQTAVRYHIAVNERHQRDRAAHALGRAGLC